MHQKNMSVQCIPHYTLLLHRKTGVCRGIPIFLISAPKHRLRVLTIYVLRKNNKNIVKNPMNFSIFTAENNICISHEQVFVIVVRVNVKMNEDQIKHEGNSTVA